MKEFFEEKLENHQKSLVEFFVQNGKVSLLFGIAICFLGLAATNAITKESAPNIEYGVVNIATPYAGVNAQDMDALVTQKIEAKIKSITSIKKYTSVSQNGISNITATLRTGADTLKAVSDIRSKVDEAKAELPSDLDSDPIITEIDSSIQPFLQVVVSGDEKPEILGQMAEDLKKEVEAVSGVAKVDLIGKIETEMQILIDQKKMESLGISISEVQNAIRAANNDVPIGNLTLGELDYSIRFAGKMNSTQEIENVVIKNLQSQSNTAQVVKIKDIARVQENAKDQNAISRFGKNGENSENAVVVSISKSMGGDIFKADSNVKQVVEKFFQNQSVSHLQYDYLLESSDVMKQDFRELFQNATSSVLVVLLILFIFIGLRESLIASLIIPLSFLATIFVMYLTDRSLNFMTNFSMILSLGILVDTAIVIVEGVHDFLKKGFSPKEAALLSVLEFRGPLISGTATTLAVFLPLFFLPDVLGKYLSFIPITVSIVLIASLIIALLLIPSYSSVLLHTEKKEEKKSVFREKINAFFEKTIESYGNLLRLFLPQRWFRFTVFLGMFALFFLSFLIPSKFEMFPTSDSDQMTITVEKTVGTIVESTEKAVSEVEKILMEQSEIELFSTTVANEKGEISIKLLSMQERQDKKMRTSAVLESDLVEIFKTLSGSQIQVRKAENGPPSQFPVGFRVIAEDAKFLEDAKKTALELTELLKKETGTQGVTNNITEIPGEFSFTLDREKALKMGISPDSIPSLVRSALYGVVASTITRNGKDIDIRLQFQSQDISSVEDILSLKVTPLLPLSEVVKMQKKDAFSQIHRENGKLSFQVSSLLDKNGNAQEITTSINTKIAEGALPIPSSVKIEDASENAENAELFSALLFSGILAIFLMFIILVIQFNSFSQPLLILQTILFAQIGVSIGLFLTDTPKSLAYILGIISLSGIVVNDAIIFIDRINRNLKVGNFSDRFEAIVDAGKTRFIPIVLTTLTTAAGILPLVFVDAFWAGLAYTIVFGLCMATFLTLFVTPMTYALWWKKDEETKITH